MASAAVGEVGAGVQTWAQSYGSRSYDVNGAPTTESAYGSGSDVAAGIARMPDGGFVVAGQLDLPELSFNANGQATGFNSDAALVRYAADGRIIWQQLIRQDNDTPASGGGRYTPASSHVYKVLTDAQGNIFICGGKGNSNNGGQLPFVAKFNAGGALIWQRGISNPSINSNGVTSTAALTRDGGVLVALAQGISPQGGSYDPGLAKLNSDGSLAFYAVYDQAVQYLNTQAVCQSATENNVYVAVVSNGYGLTLLRINGGGNLLKVRDTRDAGTQRFETPVAVVPTADGGFATLSRAGQFGTAGVVLRKFSQSLQPLFEKWIQRTNNDQFIGDDLVAEADGGFLISGNTNARQSGGPEVFPGSGGTEATIMRVSASGALQFVSVLGGPANEGRTDNSGQPNGATYVTRAADGGFAFTTYSYSYRGESVPDKPDWWTGKTNSNRRIANFGGVAADLPLAWFTVTNVPDTGNASPTFTRAPSDVAFATTSTQPGFIFEDLAKKEGINKPDVIFQGSSTPRIVSSDTAEAIIGQHFSYHIIAGFVAPDAKLTYSATGLPDGFVLDPKTGVISGAPKAGSETNVPIIITLKVNDGDNTGTAALSLTIGRGKPLFTVNESDKPAGSAGLADQPLSFAADYPGAVAGQFIGVQAKVGAAGNWARLETGTDGYMTYDIATQRYVINSINYPAKNGVYFRALVKTSGRPDAVSNVVGPFNLASNTPRAGQTLFQVIRNGLRADFDFRAALTSPRADAAVRVESTTTPANEASWTDISSGQMIPNKNGKQFSLATNSIPPGDGIYFRSVARSAGAADSLSNIIGPYTISAATPPSITSLTLNPAASGGSDFVNPAVINVGPGGNANFKIIVKATSETFIKSLSILFDGSVLHTVGGGRSEASLDYQTNVIGDHVIEAVAVDEFGITSRAGTKPLYVRIRQGGGAAQETARSSDGNAVRQALTPSEMFTVAKSGGSWDDPATWQDRSGNPGVPGAADFAVIGNSTVRLGSGQSVYALSIDAGRLIGPGALDVKRILTINGGSFDSFVNLTLREGALCELLNASDFRFDGIFFNRGRVNVHGERGLVGLAGFINIGSVNFQSPLLTPAQVAAGLPPDARILSADSFENSGTIAIQSLLGQDGAGLLGQDGAGLVSLTGGSIISRDGAGIVSGGAGNIVANDGATIIANDGATIVANDGATIVANDGATIVSGGAGNLTSPSASSTDDRLNASGETEPSAVGNAATSPPGFVQDGGETNLSGISISGRVTLNGGVLSGSGLIAGSLTNGGGYISPGNSPGAITVTGNYQQKAGGTLIIDAAGGEAGQFDQLTTGGTATLHGKLIVQTIGGYEPLPGDPFNPLGYKSVSGSFASVSGNVQVSKQSTGLLTTLKAGAPNPPAAKLLNISTRLRVEQGENVLIGGFSVTGSSPKKVLIRALGPSLSTAGIKGTLDDPTLELDRNDPGNRKFNDDWKSGTPDQIPNGFEPSDERESVIVATVAPGPHTAIVSGKGDNTGVAVVEVYDLEGAAPEALANISTRGLVQTGDKVMIGGFIIGGEQPAKVLIRAIGPSLPKEIKGALADPELELRDANGSSITNDDWRNTQEAEIAATGVPPPDGRESAVIATLVPGGYTAIIRGKGETTGIAVVEAFNLQ